MVELDILQLGFKISTGAPYPIMLCSEYKTVLIFYIEKYNHIKISFPIERQPSDDKKVAVFEFENCFKSYLGDPGENSIGFHKLSKYGLSSYKCYNVRNSNWVAQAEARMTKPLFPVSPIKHFVFTFHDSTFECLFRDFKYEIINMTLKEATDKYVTVLYG